MLVFLCIYFIQTLLNNTFLLFLVTHSNENSSYDSKHKGYIRESLKQSKMLMHFVTNKCVF